MPTARQEAQDAVHYQDYQNITSQQARTKAADAASDVWEAHYVALLQAAKTQPWVTLQRMASKVLGEGEGEGELR